MTDERLNPVFWIGRLEWWGFGERCDEISVAYAESRDTPFLVLKHIGFGFYWRVLG